MAPKGWNQSDGRRLQSLRIARGFARQNDLARVMEIGDKSVSNWETGTHRPSGKKLARLAEVLGVPEHVILEGALSYDLEPLRQKLCEARKILDEALRALDESGMIAEAPPVRLVDRVAEKPPKYPAESERKET